MNMKGVSVGDEQMVQLSTYKVTTNTDLLHYSTPWSHNMQFQNI